ncbi:N-acetyltransferase family protein [Pseudomonas sp. Marseille-QA0892]
MRIIQATPEHLDLIAPMFIKYREVFGEPAYPEQSRAFLAKRLERDESVIYLALADDEDKPMGFCQLYPGYSSLSLERVWVLNGLFVEEDARRQQVADRLLQVARKMAKETNAVRLRVATRADNLAARALYESIGFEQDAEFTNYVLPLD